MKSKILISVLVILSVVEYTLAVINFTQWAVLPGIQAVALAVTMMILAFIIYRQQLGHGFLLLTAKTIADLLKTLQKGIPATLTLWESRRERYLRTYPRLNLEHWLLGCPRDRPTESPHDRLRRLKVTRELITELCQQYRPQQSLWNIIDSLTADIKTAQADCDRLDAELHEQMKHSQAYKDFEQAVKETTDSTDSTDF